MPSIKYLKNANAGKLVRPQGFTYPVGLFNTGDGNNGPTSVDYLVVAGGGGGGGNIGGGGGGDGTQVKGGNGGKGIVIVRYSGSQAATGGTVTTSPGYTIHTFTGDGTFRSNATSYSVN